MKNNYRVLLLGGLWLGLAGHGFAQNDSLTAATPLPPHPRILLLRGDSASPSGGNSGQRLSILHDENVRMETKKGGPAGPPFPQIR